MNLFVVSKKDKMDTKMLVLLSISLMVDHGESKAVYATKIDVRL